MGAVDEVEAGERLGELVASDGLVIDVELGEDGLVEQSPLFVAAATVELLVSHFAANRAQLDPLDALMVADLTCLTSARGISDVVLVELRADAAMESYPMMDLGREGHPPRSGVQRESEESEYDDTAGMQLGADSRGVRAAQWCHPAVPDHRRSDPLRGVPGAAVPDVR